MEKPTHGSSLSTQMRRSFRISSEARIKLKNKTAPLTLLNCSSPNYGLKLNKAIKPGSSLKRPVSEEKHSLLSFKPSLMQVRPIFRKNVVKILVLKIK